MSVTFFIIIYSFFQMISYIFVILTIINGYHSQTYSVVPRAVSVVLDQYPSAKEKIFSAANGPDKNYDARRLELVYQIGRLSGPHETSAIEKAVARFDMQESNQSLLGITYDIDTKCVSLSDQKKDLNFESYAAYSNSSSILMKGIYSSKVNSSDIKKYPTELLKREISAEVTSNSKCSLEIVDIGRKYDAKTLLSELSPINMYLASLSTTFYGSFNTITTKLSAYYDSDLGNSASNFLAAGWIAKSQSFLGFGNVNQRAESIAAVIANESSDQQETVLIPFTTFVVSSLVSSIVLVAAILIGGLISIIRRSQTLLSQVIDREAFEKIVLTFSAVIFSGSIFVSYLLWALFSLLWHWMLG